MSVEYRADAFAAKVPPERCIAIVRFRPPFLDVFLATLKIVGSLAVIGIPVGILISLLR